MTTDFLEYPPSPLPADSLAEWDASAPPSTKMRRWLLLTLAIVCFMASRQLLWHFGLTISQRLLSAIPAVLSSITLAIAVGCAMRSREHVPDQHGFVMRAGLMGAWVLALVVLGCLRENSINIVFKDALGLLMLTLLLLLGRYDTAWQSLAKPLVVIFYSAFILILLTYRIPGVGLDAMGETTTMDIRFVSRNLHTIGSSFNGVIMLGLILAAWGLVRRRTDIWRVLMIGGLPLYCFVDVVLFEFRGSLVSAGLLLASFVLPLSIIRRRLPVGMILGIGAAIAVALGFLAYQNIELGVFNRFDRDSQMFASRLSEADAFFQDMTGMDLMIGRGMGGWYNGPLWVPPMPDGSRLWTTNHFGFLGFVLRGGFLFLLLMTSFVVPMFLPKSAQWRRNEFNQAAVVLAPVLLFNILCNPVQFEPDGFFLTLMYGFCFARFSTPSHQDSGQNEMGGVSVEQQGLQPGDELTAGTGVYYADVN